LNSLQNSEPLQTSDPDLGGHRRELLWLKVLAFSALYINLSKVYFGSRFFAIIVDFLTVFLASRIFFRSSIPNLKFTAVEKAVLMFMSLSLIAVFHPNVPELSVGLEGYRRIAFQMLGFFIGFRYLTREQDLTSLLKFVVLVSIPILAYGVKQFFITSDFDLRLLEMNTADIGSNTIFGKLRAFGIFNGPFHLGIYSGFVFWMAFALYKKSANRFYLIVLILASLAVLASLTRSSVIALLGSVILYFLVTLNRQKLKLGIGLVILVLIAYPIVGNVFDEISELDQFFQTISEYQNLSQDERFQSRFHVYQEGIDALINGPLGYGMGSAGDAMEMYFEPTGRFHITSHNLFLRAGIETGWMGLIIIIGLFLFFLRAIWGLRHKNEALFPLFFGMLLVILVTGITGSTIEAYPMNLIFWIFMGIVSRFYYSLHPSHPKD
jgi:O-antigen ligase